MKEYFADKEGFILGSYRMVGESVGPLSTKEAKYLEMSGSITDKAPTRAASKATAAKEPKDKTAAPKGD